MPSAAVQQIRDRARQDPAFREQLATSPLTTLREYELTDDERRRFVLPNFSWLIDGELAGNARPRSVDAFALLHELGVRALVSLFEQPPPADLVAQFDLRVEHVPIADFAAPTVEQIVQAIAAIDRFREAGRPVVGFGSQSVLVKLTGGDDNRGWALRP